jgi:hypothetical protein
MRKAVGDVRPERSIQVMRVGLWCYVCVTDTRKWRCLRHPDNERGVSRVPLGLHITTLYKP